MFSGSYWHRSQDFYHGIVGDSVFERQCWLRPTQPHHFPHRPTRSSALRIFLLGAAFRFYPDFQNRYAQTCLLKSPGRGKDIRSADDLVGRCHGVALNVWPTGSTRCEQVLATYLLINSVYLRDLSGKKFLIFSPLRSRSKKLP